MAQFNSDFRSSPVPATQKPLIQSFANLTKSNKEIFNSKLLNNSEYSNGGGSFRHRTNNPNSNNSNYTSDIEKELTDLTLSIEREMEKQQKLNSVGNNNSQHLQSTSICFKCSNPIHDRNDACQAMGNTYHGDCFICISCGRSLKGKPFYNINNNVYCEEDYLYSGFLENAEKCSVCGHVIVDMILQAIGKSYHPGCFRCFKCNDCLDGLPFTLDINNRIYCIKDYYKKYAPRCAKCKQVIIPAEGSSETIRLVSMEKDFHVECFTCEECDVELSDEPKRRCYPLGNRLLCYECHMKKIELDTFAKILIENANESHAVTVDKQK